MDLDIWTAGLISKQVEKVLESRSKTLYVGHARNSYRTAPPAGYNHQPCVDHTPEIITETSEHLSSFNSEHLAFMGKLWINLEIS
jgi:hypothetical protein